ncbi:MAG: hypothetical protein J1E62_05300 [Lachnospiraceae bacterium]|nr:hypothetical protein [Lachnospiraceae bacterium]
MELPGTYKNGNYIVKLLPDGTKVRETDENEFIPAFAESCDCKITDRCDGGCPYCYEGCTPEGRHGDILQYKFLDTLHPYTELAINGNDMSHPDLVPFLCKLKEKRVIVNMTVNQIHFEKYQELICELVDRKLIYGLGISLKVPTEQFIAQVKRYPNAVIHVINGVLTRCDVERLSDNNLKLLILGYKTLRRGDVWYSEEYENITERQNWLKVSLPDIISHFQVVSFDNLALEQLGVKEWMDEEKWSEFYMGDDGNYTFYLDLVEGSFAGNSLTSYRYPLMEHIDDMFRKQKGEYHYGKKDCEYEYLACEQKREGL